jgi:hypothetical protein
MQVLVADIWTPVDTPLSHPSPSSNFGSILLPGQVIAVVEQWWSAPATSHFLLFSQELNSTQLRQKSPISEYAISQN